MAEKISKEIRRKNMQAIKSTNSIIENLIVKELWKRNFRFRRNVRSLRGIPDIAIKKYRLVIFIDSCFWHGCKLHYQSPKTHGEYWSKKIQKNRERDIAITNYYQSCGWSILRIWEHEIKNDFNSTISRIEKFILSSK